MNINKPADNPIVLPGMRVKTSERPPPRRVHGLSWLPTKARNHIIAMIGEFTGTFLFLFFAFAATQVANAAAAFAATKDGSVNKYPNVPVLLYISLAFGFSLAVNVWVFFRISGGLFNPAVTLGLCLIGAVGWIRGFLVIITQIVGAIAAAGIVSCLFPGPLNVRTTLGAETSVVRGLFIEMFLTAQLIFTIFMLAAEKHKGTFLAPVGIGLCLFMTELGGIYFTGGSLNPARSFGPDVILHTFDGYHWIYWVGPALGAILAVALYRLIKALEYETANPGADFNKGDAEVFYPDEDPHAGRRGPSSSGYDVSHYRNAVDGVSEAEMPKYENEHKERTLSKPIGLTGPSTTIKGLTALPMEKEGWAHGRTLGLETPSDGGLPILNLPYARIQAKTYDQENDIYIFKNIPFAAPPTGENRFAKPQPPLQNDTLSDGSYGPNCVQFLTAIFSGSASSSNSSAGGGIGSLLGGLLGGSGGLTTNETALEELFASLFGPSSEDCLFLDVFVPGKAVKAPDTANLPVVHWGAYVLGSKNMNNGTGIVTAGDNSVIFVASNYRVNGFGFLAGSTMETEGTPNAGLHDTHAAFNWTRSYISLLGGNPNQVSAWGESAGAGSLSALLTAYGGTQDPLFNTAVLLSPALDMEWDRTGTLEQRFQNFSAAAGCAGQGVECLRKAPLEALKAGNQALLTSPYAGRPPYQPATDGSLLPHLPTVSYGTGAHWPNLTALILSHTADEATIFLDRTITTWPAFAAYVRYFWPPPAVAARITTRFRTAHPASPQAALHALIEQSRVTCNVRAAADAFNTSAAVYNLQYAVPPALHGEDIAPTFSQPSRLLPLQGYQTAYQSYLVSLARSEVGDPNEWRERLSLPPTVEWPRVVDVAGGFFGGVLDSLHVQGSSHLSAS
ncbi:Major intrinsic protein [Neofusicoccum parvum]|nr:Major intrinsic protein [Neofusicoccum parvum]